MASQVGHPLFGFADLMGQRTRADGRTSESLGGFELHSGIENRLQGEEFRILRATVNWLR